MRYAGAVQAEHQAGPGSVGVKEAAKANEVLVVSLGGGDVLEDGEIVRRVAESARCGKRTARQSGLAWTMEAVRAHFRQPSQARRE